MPPPSENPTAALARDDAGWFVHEVQPHADSLRGYLRSSFPALRDVDDVVQESFLRVWRRRAAEPIKSARGFLFRVARNIALNTTRGERRSPIVAHSDLSEFLAVDERPSPAEVTCREQELGLLVDAVDSLPARCREIFILRRIHGVPQREIAIRLGLSEQTVQVQAARGLRRCEEYVRRKMKQP